MAIHKQRYTAKRSKLLTTVDESVLGLEAPLLLAMVRVKPDDEDTMHGDEQAGQLSDVVAAVATM